MPRITKTKPDGEGIPPAPTPWASFIEVKPNPAIDVSEAVMKREEEANRQAALEIEPGMKRYRARRDNGSGKYRRGKVYILPEGQSPELFEEMK